LQLSCCPVAVVILCTVGNSGDWPDLSVYDRSVDRGKVPIDVLRRVCRRVWCGVLG